MRRILDNMIGLLQFLLIYLLQRVQLVVTAVNDLKLLVDCLKSIELIGRITTVIHKAG